MNRGNYNQPGGLPLETQRLAEMQSSWQIFNACGALAGNLTILSGCEVTGSNIAAGYVHINGEILEFRASAAPVNARVVIIEETTPEEFENGEVKPVFYIRYAAIGVADTSWLWSDFKRPIQTKEIPVDLNTRLTLLERIAAPFISGNTPVFHGAAANLIPPGWIEDVNWRGRMPVGFDITQTEFNVIGKTGGSKTKTLTVNEMPSHAHDVIFHMSDDGNNQGRLQGGSFEALGTPPNYAKNTVDVQPTGGGQAFVILNPYRTVLFIKYVGI